MMLLLLPVFLTNASASSSDSLDISTGDVVLSTAGDYTVTGSTNKYSLSIKGNGTYNVTLKGVNINPAMNIPIQVVDSSSIVNLILADGTENSVNTSAYYAIYSKGNLTISGSGSLTTREQIHSESKLTLNVSGSITTSSIDSNYGLNISGSGILLIESEESYGIHCQYGNIDISNCKINISGPRAIDCENYNLKISDCQLDILYDGSSEASGLYANSIAISGSSNININISSTSGFTWGIRGEFSMSGGNLNISSSFVGINTLTIKNIGLSTKPDILWSAGSFKFTGGTITITGTGNDFTGITSGSASISDKAVLNITVSGKGSIGISANSVGGTLSMTGGTVNISSTAYGIKCYDNINISGGSINVKVSGDNKYLYTCGIYSNLGKILISGGTVISTASHPLESTAITATGIRSNSGPVISGGTVTASGTTRALDSNDNSLKIYGTLLISAGSKAEDASVVSAYGGEVYVSISSESDWKNPYSDVLDTDWFYHNVAFANLHGLIAGTGISSFSPYQNVSRAMIATIIWRIADKPESTGSVTLTDVASSSYYAKAAAWSVESKIMADYGSETFRPDNYPSREQLILIMYRYAKYKNYDITSTSGLSGFTDADEISSAAVDAMKWAVNKGIISGSSDGALDPDGLLNRAQFAAILQRFLNTY